METEQQRGGGGLIEREVFTNYEGLRMFTVEQSGGISGQVQEVTKDSATVYYKSAPGLVTPFGLPFECFPKFQALIDKDAGLVPAVNVMMSGAVAGSTAKQYKPVILEMLNFCRETEGAFPYFSEASALHFIAEMFMRKRPLGFFQTLVPALALLESISGRPDTGLTDTVRDSVNAIQRKLAASKPAVKKATGFTYSVFNSIIEKELLPWMDRMGGVNPYHFRSLFRATVIYFTVFRFEDFANLTDKDFEDCGEYIKVIFHFSHQEK